ncbi:MAG TPA: P-loop NTPase fold protein [Fluviicola sp.]|nr:P-loop NTPase fold protein [Fluviicola sp.]
MDRYLWKQRLWIPLMGTGAGGLEEEESFDTTIEALSAIYKDLSPAEVIISVSSHFDPSLVEVLKARLPEHLRNEPGDENLYDPEKPLKKGRSGRSAKTTRAVKVTMTKAGKEELNENENENENDVEELGEGLKAFTNAFDTSGRENNRTRATSISYDGGDKDSLDFDKEAQSLAALVTLKELQPPLAIALFGTWGSGKSFFMRQIEKRARELSIYQGFIVSGKETESAQKDPDKALFHSGIAHITLNAWSYLDANLWAGLTHSLFEKLNEYITNNTKGSIEKFKVQVKITKRLEVLNNDLNHFKEKKTQLVHLKEKLEKERDNKILRHFQLRGYDESVKKFLKSAGLHEEEIKLLTPSNIEKFVKSSVSFVTYLRANSNKVLLQLIGATVLVLLVKFGAQGLAAYYEKTRLANFLQSIFAGIAAPILPVFGWVAKFLVSKRSTVKKVKDYINDLSGETNDPALIQLQSDLKEVDALIGEIETSIDEEYSKTSDITQLAITNFISSKHEQDAYQKHLGIITTIRKDFETLSELFSDLNKPKMPMPSAKEQERQESIETDKAIITESFESNRKLERIILYIDDLDRCSDEKVMEVLEAVHLLMAFPLFIVIVGVDERSVHNALINRQLDRYRGINNNVIINHFHKIEPREYLEKIFQIPFHLPVPDTKGVLKLIDDLIPVVGPAVTYKAPDSKEPVKADPKPESYPIDVDLFAKNVISEPKISYEKMAFSTPEVSSVEAEDMKSKEPEVVTVAPESVLITSEEKEYLQLLSCLVGSNPRTIKRYINIYRIVKTHDNSIIYSKEKMVMQLFLTALFTGKFKREAFELFNKDSGSALITLVRQDRLKPGELYEDLEKQLSVLAKQDKILSQLFLDSMENLKKESEFIQRFSYRITSPG